MAIICKQKQLLFIMVPRTGCSAIGKLLIDHHNGEWLIKEDAIDTLGEKIKRRKHASISEILGYGLMTQEELNGYYKIGSVRNPFDSLISMYLKKRNKYKGLLDDPESWVHWVNDKYADEIKFCQNHSFEEWVNMKFQKKSILFFNKIRKTSMFHSWTEGLDHILKFESLQTDLDHVFSKLEMSTEHQIPQYNITESKKKHYSEYYSQKTRKIVEHVFAEDLETFGYQF